MKKNKIILSIIIVIILLGKVLAYPSNIIILVDGQERYIIKAEEEEIPKGFYKDRLNMGVVVEAYKNGPLTIVKMCDEEYNSKFVAVDENEEGKPYDLYTQDINGEIYYIIPYQISEYEKSSYGLKPYKTKVKEQMMTCYSSDKYGYEKITVYGINSEGKLKLLAYEDDEFNLLDPIQEKNDTTQPSNVSAPENTVQSNNTPQSTSETQPNDLNSFNYITIIYIVIIVVLLVGIKLLLVKLVELRKK